MSPVAGDEAGGVVATQFDASPRFWEDVYADPGVNGRVYRGRMATALSWIDELRLAPGSQVLEVGCGAGLLSVALARRGLAVTATDASREMLALAQHRFAGTDAGNLTLTHAEADALPFEAERFALVVGLGLLPWVPDIEATIAEIVRVAAPGGGLLLTADNRARLNFIVEPRESPLLAPIKLARRTVRAARRIEIGPGASLHRPGEIDRLLRSAGAEPERRTTFGFGPFTVLGSRLMPERAAITTHERLQRRAARSPALRRTGWHYIVLARRA